MNTTKKRTISKFSLGTDVLWYIIIFAGILFITSLIPLVPNDFWWHLKTGEWIYLHHSIPTTNKYAWSIPADTPYSYGSWLGELLSYIFYRWGGLNLTIFIRTFLWGITLWIVGHETKRLSGSWRISAILVAFGFIMTLNNLQARPQMWSWLPFIIFLIYLNRYVDRQLNSKLLLLLPGIMIFWVNIHGAFILGIALVVIYLVGEIIRKFLRTPYHLSKKEILWLSFISLLTGLATLINPRFLNIFYYVVDLLTDKPSQQLVIEWQSPTPQGIAGVVFYLSILVLIVFLSCSKHRLTPSTLLVTLAFLWMAWSGVRYVVWYAIIIMLILAKLSAQLPVRLPVLYAHKSPINIIIALLCSIPVILVQPWFVDNFPLPDTYRTQILSDIPIGPLISVETPISAANYLKAHPGGYLFNEMGYGSYLIWEIPEQGVFVDPRVELYSYEQWQDYLRISSGTDYNRLLNEYSANRILLSKEIQPNLSKSLLHDPLWQLEYEDQYSQIWILLGSEDT